MLSFPFSFLNQKFEGINIFVASICIKNHGKIKYLRCQRDSKSSGEFTASKLLTKINVEEKKIKEKQFYGLMTWSNNKWSNNMYLKTIEGFRNSSLEGTDQRSCSF